MNGFLLDTNVLSEARKGRRANPNVYVWLDALDDEALYVSVLVLGEIRKAIEQARPRDAVKARMLERWLAGLENSYSERLLPVTAAIAGQWGQLSAIRPISVMDGLLAATALVHGLTFVTRNTEDVAHTGVSVLNPFTAT